MVGCEKAGLQTILPTCSQYHVARNSHPQLFIFELVSSLSIPYEMSYQEIPPPADHSDAAPKESVWRSAWNNNKGACLILLAEFAGMSGDAIARYLQQGDAKFNPLQVRHS